MRGSCVDSGTGVDSELARRGRGDGGGGSSEGGGQAGEGEGEGGASAAEAAPARLLSQLYCQRLRLAEGAAEEGRVRAEQPEA